MLLLWTYLKSWKKEDTCGRCISGVAKIFLRSTHCCGELFKPWQRQLGQYSILDSCSYKQRPLVKTLITSIALFGIRFPRPGSASLTNEIKEAVIQALRDRGRQLTNGISILQTSDLPQGTRRKLAWAMKLARACTQLHTDAQVVLVWHIATSLCEIKLNQLHLSADDDDINVAISLSRYCAYLVAFAPNMLPGHAASTNYTCTETILHACKCLKNCTQEDVVYQKLMEITVKDGVDVEFDDPNGQIDAASILQQGAVLGKVLITKIEDPSLRWKVLAGFWAKMILYLAPNACNEWAHVERLADGGEFITHLWVLLFHAGIVDRDSFNINVRDTEVDPIETHQV